MELAGLLRKLDAKILVEDYRGHQWSVFITRAGGWRVWKDPKREMVQWSKDMYNAESLEKALEYVVGSVEKT